MFPWVHEIAASFNHLSAKKIYSARKPATCIRQERCAQEQLVPTVSGY